MRQAAVAAALLAVIAVAGLMLRRGCSARPAERLLAVPYEQLGRVLADETLRAVPGPGRIVVLRYRLATPGEDAVLGPAAETFLRAIRDDGRLRIAAIERDEYNPFEREAGWARTMMASSRFVEFLARHGDAEAVVIVGGTPQLLKADAARLPAVRPRIVAAAILTPPDPWLLREGVLAAAIVSRPEASQERRPPQSAQEWFDRRYQVVRAGPADGAPR